jgi:hypothetical protein
LRAPPLGHKSEIFSEDERLILDWIAAIGENDPAIIADTLQRCRHDSECRNYFIARAKGEL